MDNGLIFPYPRAAAQAGPGEAKPAAALPFRGGAGTGPGRAGSRRAGGVTQEGSSTGRWLSRGKGARRRAGKSARHEPQARCRAVTGEVSDPVLPRKTPRRGRARPVPQTDAGGQAEHAEAIG
jgi:hypothetical protein